MLVKPCLESLSLETASAPYRLHDRELIELKHSKIDQVLQK
jgi:hypothetical protein